MVRRYVSEIESKYESRNYSVNCISSEFFSPSCEICSRNTWNLHFLFIMSNKTSVKDFPFNFYDSKYHLPKSEVSSLKSMSM
jgi:hypothetical protein